MRSRPCAIGKLNDGSRTAAVPAELPEPIVFDEFGAVLLSPNVDEYVRAFAFNVSIMAAPRHSKSLAINSLDFFKLQPLKHGNSQHLPPSLPQAEAAGRLTNDRFGEVPMASRTARFGRLRNGR